MVLGHDIHTSERTKDVKITEDISFDSMLLSPITLAGLKSSGFYVPSPIQLHGIPLGKCGFDLLLEAKSGTGKTAVFSVIALEKLNLKQGVQCLILAPTREIASQVCDVIKTIGAFYAGLCVEVVMGGLPFAEDVEKFKKKVHIVVGSPGRLHHLIKDKYIDVSSVRLIVLDEADKLVEKSFLPDINFIYSTLPNQKQIIMSSATYGDHVRLAMKKYVINAHHICPDSNSVLLGIEQNVLKVPHHINIVTQTNIRYKELSQILSKKQFKQCLVFCNYQVRVGEVHRMLNKDKWPADKLHGQQEQTDRLEALKILQSYQCRILVTTDLAARGIDASNVDLVINFEPPYNWQTYLHRIGRAGRFGSYGSAISIICEGEEEKKFKVILGSIKIPFNLKHFWTKEPYLLGITSINNEINLKKSEMSQKEHVSSIEDQTQKFRVRETYDEIWNILSGNSNGDIDDIPTFEELNISFCQVMGESNKNVIESFSDLLSSFENHELKKNDPVYKAVEVNKSVKASLLFNLNSIMPSIENKCESFVKDNNEILISSKKTIPLGLDDKSDNKVFTEEDETSSKNLKYISNGNCASGIHSSGYNNFDIANLKPNKNISMNASINETQIVENIVIHHEQNSCNELNLVNEAVYNQDEKSLLDANLPTAFGKIKQKKSKKKNKVNLNKADSNVINIEQNCRMQQNINKTKPKSTSNHAIYSSSDGENTEMYSDNLHKLYSKAQIQSQQNTKKSKTYCQKQSFQNMKNIEERQQQFNAWYQQLQFYRQFVEQSVYIQIMSSSQYY